MSISEATLAAVGAGVVVGVGLTLAVQHLTTPTPLDPSSCSTHASQHAPTTEDGWMELCQSQRIGRNDRLPSQSNFRVTAIIAFTRGRSKQLEFVVGHNDEACCLLNSTCAERAGFLQLASIQGEGKVFVKAVYLCSDARNPITPGALCREFMYSSVMTSPTMPVVMEGSAGPDGRITRTLVRGALFLAS